MKRDELILEVSRFTSTSAAAREILALLEHSDYKLIVKATEKEFEELEGELENSRCLGRIKVMVLVP